MSRKRTVDLNADVGEATDASGIDVERTLLALVTTAHIACGGHAGDADSMAATVDTALEHSVRIGAHPSYPDRDGFGRQPVTIDQAELRAALHGQLAGLARVARSAGTTVDSVKAHGMLYEEVAKGGVVYETFRDAVRDTYRRGRIGGVALGLSRLGHGDARRGRGRRGGLLRPGVPARRRPGRPEDGGRPPGRSPRGGRAGAQPGQGRGRGS